MPTADILPPGTMVGRYRIETPLATGGPDGAVYRAHDAASARRVVVLEFLPPGIARRRPDAATEEAAMGVEPIDADFRPLFAAGVAEIQALAVDFMSFRHANVLSFLDCFAANATVYLVIEAPDGRTLDRLLGPSEALSPEEVQEILPALLAGADAIHKAGLLHLDICPAAIAIRRDGTAALGRAHLVRRTLGAPERGAVLSARDAYRAEEYFQPNGKLGPWTDIYALAATLFRLATGKPPPDALTRQRELAGGQADPVAAALDAVTGAWPAQFVTALRHGLAIPPHNRPQNVSALRAAFGAASQGEVPTLPLRDPAAARDARTKPIFPAKPQDEIATVRTRPPSETVPVPCRAAPPASEAPTARMERPSADPDATKPLYPPRPPAQFSGPPANQDETATVRMAHPESRVPAAPRPIVAPPPLPAPPAGEDKKTTVIYRRGRAEVVTAPAKDAHGPPPAAAASDAEAAILPARFSVFHPMTMAPGQWLDLAVYLHEPGIDSFVRQDHTARFEGRPRETPERRSALRYSLRPGAAVTVVPYLPGCRINPPRATVEWWENFHRLNFRVMANPGAPGYAEGPGAGAIFFFVGPLLVGEARLAVTVGREKTHPISNTAALAADTFDAVFPAYAPQDGEIADRFAALGTQVDNPFLAEILELRGREWEREILKRIEAAERFQLLWSAAAARSPHLEEEWKFALALGREHFIRPFYWRHPAPGLPAALDAADLRYLVLTLE